MVLSVNELKEESKLKLKKNKELYKELLNNIYKKIQKKNKEGLYSLIYILRPIIPGKPLINIDHAGVYIQKKLSQGKFKTQIIHNKIYIDWS